VVVSFTSAVGQSYLLEYTDSLITPAWSVALDSVPGTGNIVSITHIGGANGGSRFYRIRRIP